MNEFSWDNKYAGAQVLLSKVLALSLFIRHPLFLYYIHLLLALYSYLLISISLSISSLSHFPVSIYVNISIFLSLSLCIYYIHVSVAILRHVSQSINIDLSVYSSSVPPYPCLSIFLLFSPSPSPSRPISINIYNSVLLLSVPQYQDIHLSFFLLPRVSLSINIHFSVHLLHFVTLYIHRSPSTTIYRNSWDSFNRNSSPGRPLWLGTRTTPTLSFAH